ncbi:DUF3923 family protein [Fructilactobacillus frigidiflavus]|uniref:DUF3923 family protein n=1 Tax=Fructilactobacillus frigidiflavus TaxID=3242688 RepID=UPI00375719AE
MRMGFKIWSVVTILEVITYGLLSVMIFMRSVDGAGVAQTPRIKMVTWYLLSGFYAFFFVIQLIWFLVMKVINKK